VWCLHTTRYIPKSCSVIQSSDALAVLRSQGKINAITQDMDRHRADAFQARMNDGKNKGHQLKDVGNRATVRLETNNLNSIRDLSYGIHSSDVITICADARIGKTISTKLGSLSHTYQADTTMDGMYLSSHCNFWNLLSLC
jgi:hypothetical protein